MVTAKVALRPKNEAPRKTWPGLRGTANFINSNDATDTIPPLQLQCLARYGVTGPQAAMLASLIWPDGGNAPWGGAA